MLSSEGVLERFVALCYSRYDLEVFLSGAYVECMFLGEFMVPMCYLTSDEFVEYCFALSCSFSAHIGVFFIEFGVCVLFVLSFLL